MNTQDVLIVGIFAAGAFFWIENDRREKEEIAALQAQNDALRAAADRRRRESGTDWAGIALGAIPVVGGVIKAVL